MNTVIPSIRRVSSTTPRDDQSQYLISDAKFTALENHVLQKVTNAPSGQELEVYLGEKPSQNKQFEDILLKTLVLYSPSSMQTSLKTLLDTLK